MLHAANIRARGPQVACRGTIELNRVAEACGLVFCHRRVRWRYNDVRSELRVDRVQDQVLSVTTQATEMPLQTRRSEQLLGMIYRSEPLTLTFVSGVAPDLVALVPRVYMKEANMSSGVDLVDAIVFCRESKRWGVYRCVRLTLEEESDPRERL